MKMLHPCSVVSMLAAITSAFLLFACDPPRAGRNDPDPTSNGIAKLDTLQSGDYTLSGPFVHKNLSIFLVHGRDRAEGASFLTLQEAMEQKKVIVHETQDVNELSVENVSDQQVFIQASDIVKGGQQDRVLANDLILQPHSGIVPIDAFCVEHGRWEQRGSENVQQFTSSDNQLASKDLKMAAKYEANQGKVWDKVSETQEKLQMKLGAPVRSSASESSLQLTLENDRVRENADEYVAALAKIIDGGSDVIGYAFAINGTINSADVYASGELFRKLWPKMLRASAVEAVADYNDGDTYDPVTVEAVGRRIADAETGQATERQINGRTKIITNESAGNVLFETRDSAVASGWVHRNYVTK